MFDKVVGKMPRDEKNQDRLAVSKLTELVEYDAGSVASKTVVDKKSASVAVYAYDRFQEIIAHVLPYDALFYVLEGEAEVTVEGKSYVVNAGEIVVLPANKPHAISPKSKFKVLLVAFKE